MKKEGQGSRTVVVRAGSGEGKVWLAMAGNLQERCDGRKTRQRRSSSQAGASRFAGSPSGRGVGKATLGTEASPGHPAVTLL